MTRGQSVILGLLLIGWVQAASADDCRVASLHGNMMFPVDRLTAESRCLLAEVIDHPSASGVVGPNDTPIGLPLYGYLLDHPTMTTQLMKRMGMGSFQILAKGLNRYWVDDGEGAEGLLSVILQDSDHRIYYIDGRHRSVLFPTIRAKTVVFMRLMPAPSAQGRSGVQTILASYTRFEDGMLSRLLDLFHSLVTRAVNRTLAKEFGLTHRLGMLITEDPQRVLQEAAGLSEAGSDEWRALLALIQAEALSSTPPNAAP
jgi:hypothetical protein